jgi:hypothetical protein
VVGEDLRAPALERVPEGLHLGYIVVEATGDGLVEEQGGDGGIVGEINVSHRFLRQPRTENMVVGVTEAKPEQHPRAAAFVEALGAGQQELSDAVERVVLPPAVAEELVLHTPAHGVEAAVGDSDDVKGICL